MPNNACRRDGCNGRYLNGETCVMCGHGRDLQQHGVKRLHEGYRLTERSGAGRLYYAQGGLNLRRDPMMR